MGHRGSHLGGSRWVGIWIAKKRYDLNSASIKTSFNLKKIIYSDGSFFSDVGDPKVGSHPGGDPPRWGPT